LNLSIVKHTRLYRLQWLNDSGKMKMTKQVLILFFNRKYADEVLCDVVPIPTSHTYLRDHDRLIGRQHMMGIEISILL